MAFENVKNNFGEIKENTEKYISTNVAYIRLWGFKVTAKAASAFLTLTLVVLFATISLLFMSIAAAYAIGSQLNSVSLGFLIIGGIYLITTLIAFFFRKSLVEQPVLKKLSEIFFND